MSYYICLLNISALLDSLLLVLFLSRVVLFGVQSLGVMSRCIRHGNATCSVTWWVFQWLVCAWVECLLVFGAYWSCRAGLTCMWKPALCRSSARTCRRCCLQYQYLCWMMCTRELLSGSMTEVRWCYIYCPFVVEIHKLMLAVQNAFHISILLVRFLERLVTSVISKGFLRGIRGSTGQHK